MNNVNKITLTLPELSRPYAETIWPAVAKSARADGYHWIAEQIREQTKAPVEEPTGDVTVWAGGEAYTPEGDDRRWLGPGGVERDWSFLAMHDPMIYRRESPEPTPEQVEGLRPEIDPDAWRAEVEAASAPGVPVEKVRALRDRFDWSAKQAIPDECRDYGRGARDTCIQAVRALSALLPKEPTS